MKIWKEIQVESWKDFEAKLEKECDSIDWIFRGQADKDWPVKSSLYITFEENEYTTCRNTYSYVCELCEQVIL